MNELAPLIETRVAGRTWERDTSLWEGEDPKMLGWLQLAEEFPATLAALQPLADELTNAGLEQTIVLGMGGSSLTAEMLKHVFIAGSPRLQVLDILHPDALRAVNLVENGERIIFLISSKSGTTAETLLLEAHFRALMAKQLGSAAAKRFIFLSDQFPSRADRSAYRSYIQTPEDVGGRFSALSAFGMLPAILAGMEPGRWALPLQRMVRLCRDDVADNPGLKLGANLAFNALKGKDKVTLITSPQLQSFGLWVEQLLAESTGKNNGGLVPCTGEDLPAINPENYGAERNFVYMRLNSDDNAVQDQLWQKLQERGETTTLIELNSVEEIGAEIFKWEFAVAVAGHVLKINPFDQPNVEEAKVRARQMLSNPPERIAPNFTALEELMRQLPNLTEERGINYVALLAYLPPTPALDAAIRQLRVCITLATGLPTLFGYGPRYLHSTGQLLKGGRSDVLAVGLLNRFEDIPPPPGQSHSPGELMSAQAQGDFGVMRDSGRAAVTLELGYDPAAELLAALEVGLN